MNDPKQLYLFNELEYDDMDADDYEQAYYDYLVEHIWVCCVEKHEAVSRAAFAILQQLTGFLNAHTLELVWKRIKTLDESEFDELKVSFLKEYTIGALICLEKH